MKTYEIKPTFENLLQTYVDNAIGRNDDVFRFTEILNSLDDKPIEERNIDFGYYYKEAYKIIDPIKLGISSTMKANAKKGIKSGKLLLKKYSKDYLTLFDEDDFN